MKAQEAEDKFYPILLLKIRKAYLGKTYKVYQDLEAQCIIIQLDS